MFFCFMDVALFSFLVSYGFTQNWELDDITIQQNHTSQGQICWILPEGPQCETNKTTL